MNRFSLMAEVIILFYIKTEEIDKKIDRQTNGKEVKKNRNLHEGKNETKMKVSQLCPTLCDVMGCSPPGSYVHGILQTRILDCVTISFSRGSS